MNKQSNYKCRRLFIYSKSSEPIFIFFLHSYLKLATDTVNTLTVCFCLKVEKSIIILANERITRINVQSLK